MKKRQLNVQSNELYWSTPVALFSDLAYDGEYGAAVINKYITNQPSSADQNGRSSQVNPIENN